MAGSTTTFSNTGLTASTTYYYRVAAVNASGIGTPSDEASATTSGALPAKVADLTVTPISTSQLNLFGLLTHRFRITTMSIEERQLDFL